MMHRRHTMAESYTGEAYCVKCKAKKPFTGHVEEKNNRRMAKGKCPDCGTTLNRILGKAS
jgi:NAD-dependent SIR2 family protein deacetylase